MARILVVDDDEAIRATLRLLLEDNGHQVSEAASGWEALTTLRSSPDRLVVLLDLVMPNMNGDDVLRAVAADSALAARHSYVLISAATTRDIDAATPIVMDLGGQVIRKPFDIDALLHAVAVATEHMRG
jgi:CheY-like chemotaxis protein